MLVYLPHKNANHTVFVCPGGHLNGKTELPSDWVNDKNEPLTFQVEFKKGVAEVDKKLGEYMIEHGIARKTQLIQPGDE